jgi:membrane-anchored mycosin MYCP
VRLFHLLAGVLLLSAATVPFSGPGGVPQASEVACTIKRGGPLTSAPWPRTRLAFQRAWGAAPGRGVTVAVIDSGLEKPGPLAAMHTRTGYNVLDDSRETHDCANHGTAVAAIIAAPAVPGSRFVGVAPEATILPIKQSNGETQANGTAAIAAAIRLAIAARAQVANLSVSVTTPTPALRAAVRAADRAGLVLVCAAGNDGQGNNLPTYPAAYSPRFPNVIAVSATDANDAAAPFTQTGSYVDLAAPGLDVPVPASGGGFLKAQGTSFAAPYVTGTVALMLSADPSLRGHPDRVRRRLEATADAPPATVPDKAYGYGIVNPYLAVNAVVDDAAPTVAPAPAAPLPAPTAPAAADRHLQHVALGAAAALLGLAVLAVAGAAVIRGARRRPGRPG